MAISKTQRWLDLIAFLAKRRFPVTVEDLMLGVPAYAQDWKTGDETKQASVRRKFERDKDELRAAGIPLETRPHRIDGVETQGYVLAEGEFFLPYLRIVAEGTTSPAAASQPRRPPLDGASARSAPEGAGRSGSTSTANVEVTAEHAQLAMDALRRVAELPDSPFAAEARTALAKLRFDLEPPAEDATLRLREPAARFDADLLAPAPVHYAGTPGGVRELLQALTGAVRARRRVRFTYHGIGRGETTHRDVAPYGLLYQGGNWYLIGHDATRDAVRVFRLGRMENLEEGADGSYEPDPEFELARYARRQPWELGEEEPVEVTVRFAFPLSLWAERNDHGEEVERGKGGAVVRRFEVRQPDAFLRWLQSFGGDAVVTGPAELRREQVEMAGETAALYGNG